MKKRLLTGIRPTGFLHLGHLEGMLKNSVSLQEKYDCFLFVADWHNAGGIHVVVRDAIVSLSVITPRASSMVKGSLVGRGGLSYYATVRR